MVDERVDLKLEALAAKLGPRVFPEVDQISSPKLAGQERQDLAAVEGRLSKAPDQQIERGRGVELSERVDPKMDGNIASTFEGAAPPPGPSAPAAAAEPPRLRAVAGGECRGS